MTKSEAGKLGGKSRSPVKITAVKRNVEKALITRLYNRRQLPFPLLWLIDLFQKPATPVLETPAVDPLDNMKWLARQAFELALATEKYGAKFFGNGARPAGILTLPSKLEDKAIDTLRRSWAEAHGGENQFKVAVLEQGLKYEKLAKE